MRGHFPIPGDLRPRPVASDGAATAIAPRFFCCARCRRQSFICSHCDRGQIYCARGCAGEARRLKQREAGRRYQLTFRGRRNHAARMARYRARQNKVTHQGSPERPVGELLSLDPETAENGDVSASGPVASDSLSATRCHWCACRCPDRLRHDYLRRRRVHAPDQVRGFVEIDRTGRGNDDTS